MRWLNDSVWIVCVGVFLAIWVFLHLLVLAFGFLNYQLNDSYTIARKTFGIGFGKSGHPAYLSRLLMEFLQHLLVQRREFCSSMPPLSSSPFAETSSPFADGPP